MCIPYSEIKLSFHWAALKHCFCRICNWTFGTLSGLWWKRKYPHKKTTQKYSDKLPCYVCIPHSEVKLSLHWAVLKHSFCRICNWTFGVLSGLWWKRNYLHIKTTQKHSAKLLSHLCIYITDLNLSFDWAVLEHSFRRIWKWTFGALWGLCWKRKYVKIKTTQKHSVKLPCYVCIPHWEIKLSCHWAVLKHSFCRICNGTFGALSGLWWKMKYLNIKTTQKHSDQLSCFVCIPHSELKLSCHWAVLKHSFCRICLWTFRVPSGLWWKRK